MFSALKSCETDESDGDNETIQKDTNTSMQTKKLKKSKSKTMSMGDFLSSNTLTNSNSSIPSGFTEVSSHSHRNKKTLNRNNSNRKYSNKEKNFQYKNNNSSDGKYKPYQSYNPEKEQFRIIDSKFPHLNKETKKNIKKSKSRSQNNIGMWNSRPELSKSEIVETKSDNEEIETSTMKTLSLGMNHPQREKESTFHFHRISSRNRINQVSMIFDDINNNNDYDNYEEYDDYYNDHHDNDYDNHHSDNSFDSD